MIYPVYFFHLVLFVVHICSTTLTNSSCLMKHISPGFDVFMYQVKIRVFRGHEDEVNKCQFFAEDSRVLSISADCNIKIWDPRQGTELRSLDNMHSLNPADVHCMEDGSKSVHTHTHTHILFLSLFYTHTYTRTQTHTHTHSHTHTHTHTHTHIYIYIYIVVADVCFVYFSMSLCCQEILQVLISMCCFMNRKQ